MFLLKYKALLHFYPIVNQLFTKGKHLPVMRVRCDFSCTTSIIDSGPQGIRWHFARVRCAAKNHTSHKKSPGTKPGQKSAGESRLRRRFYSEISPSPIDVSCLPQRKCRRTCSKQLQRMCSYNHCLDISCRLSGLHPQLM